MVNRKLPPFMLRAKARISYAQRQSTIKLICDLHIRPLLPSKPL